jgi:hypothetical protein
LSLAALAYNVLRLIGQHTLLGKDAPLRHPAKRRRLKTVIQELIAIAAHHLRFWPALPGVHRVRSHLDGMARSAELSRTL